MTGHQPLPDDHAPRRVREVVLVADMVESVRLMQHHADDVIARWRVLVDEVRSQLLPGSGGRLVKSLGDGLLMVFHTESAAAATALQMQQRCQRLNDGCAADAVIRLRVGLHTCDLIADDLDVYGAGVNLAARMAANAQPGEVLASADVLGGLTPGLDVDVEDLGELYFKHIDTPTRTFRIAAPGSQPAGPLVAAAGPDDVLPTLAIVPPQARLGAAEVLGEMVADELITRFSRAPELRVISRLSTTQLRGRNLPLDELGATVGAQYLVTGAYLDAGPRRLRMNLQLHDVRSTAVIWAADIGVDLDDLLAGEGTALQDVVANIGAAIASEAVRRVTSAPLPSLDSCTLLMGAIGLMHRNTRREFDHARTLLEALSDRHRRFPQAHAWLGKWHVLRAVQGWTTDRQRDTQEALSSVRRALDADPSFSLALAIEGLVQAYLRKDLGAASALYEQALHHNPSDSLAWLFLGTLHSYRDEGNHAAQAADRALGLSPLDPMRYFYDSLAATAVLSDGQYDRAIELARRSLRLNRSHTSTYRTLAIAQMLRGAEDDARRTVSTLRELEPELTVAAFVQRYPGQVSGQVDRYARALRAAGLPD